MKKEVEKKLKCDIDKLGVKYWTYEGSKLACIDKDSNKFTILNVELFNSIIKNNNDKNMRKEIEKYPEFNNYVENKTTEARNNDVPLGSLSTSTQKSQELKIKKEYEERLFPLTEDEYNELKELIVKEGCRELILIWNGFIVDGHNRYRICKENKIEFKTREMNFSNEDEVLDFIDRNQIGRRNLGGLKKEIVIGRIYETEKRKQGDVNRFNSDPGGQNDHLGKTAENLAKKLNISEKTIRRAAENFKALEKIKKEGGMKIYNDIVLNSVKLKKKDLKLASENVEQLKDIAYNRPEKISNFSNEINKIKHTSERMQTIHLDTEHGLKIFDTIEYIKTLEDQTIDCLIIDPQVNEKDDKRIFDLLDNILTEVKPKLKDNAHLYIFAGWGDKFLKTHSIVGKHFSLQPNWLIWVKTPESSWDNKKRYVNKYENILFAKINTKRLLDKGFCLDVLEYTEKEKLIEQLIKNSTLEGEIVLDCYADDSTIKACNNTNRIFKGCPNNN